MGGCRPKLTDLPGFSESGKAGGGGRNPSPLRNFPI